MSIPAASPFAPFVAPIAKLHVDMVAAGCPLGYLKTVCGALNLAIRFSIPGESRVPMHESQALWDIMASLADRLSAWPSLQSSALLVALQLGKLNDKFDAANKEKA